MGSYKILGLLLLLLSVTAINAQDSEAQIAITLERGPCFGACPVYTITILDDGTVLYDGQRFVDVTGEQTIQIDPETVQMMVDAFERAGYFEWAEAYDTRTISDLPTIITSVTREGKTHRIVRYTGDSTAPIALPYLEIWIDMMTNSQLLTGVEPDLNANTVGMDSPLITLQREPCFGFCPVYNVALYEDGTIVYVGIANVDEIGVRVLEADPLAIASLAQRASIIGYFDWQERYDHQVMTDQATVITSVRYEDNFKRIMRYDGDPNAPIGLVRLEDSIDQLVSESTAEGDK